MNDNSQQMKFGYDRLTGLATADLFYDLCEKRVRQLRHQERENAGHIVRQPLFFVYYNVENFKAFNSENGYKAGDELLKKLANLITETYEDSIVGRTSNDHFIVLTSQPGIEEKSIKIHEQVHQLEKNAKVEILTGIYEYEEGVSFSQAHDRAKTACDMIKGDYSRILCYYDDELRKKLAREKYIVDNIDIAIEREYLQVYYQPVIRVVTNKICGVESLVRWNDPILGFLTPGEFIPILEQRHLIHKLDQYMLDRVCRDQNASRNLGETIVPASVNLSRVDFRLIDVYAMVSETVKKHKIDPATIHLEITESALDENENDLQEIIDHLRKDGFEVWMDDFGSQYSTLNTLQNYHFDLLKIDMNFFRNFETNENASTIIASITDMAKRLHMRVLAEGIETKEQLDFLQKIGCDKAQGYYFSKPCPLDVFYGLPFEREPMEERQYFSAIGRVNFLSPNPIEDYQDTDKIYNLIPTAIVQYKDEHFTYLYTNEGFVDCLNSMGVDDSQRSEEVINDDSAKLKTRLAGVAKKCHMNRKMEGVDFVFHGFHINVRAREIAYNQGTQAFFVTMVNLSVMGNFRKIDQLETSLNFLYSIYDRVDMLNPQEDSIENIYLNAQYYRTSFEGKTLRDSIIDYGHTDIAVEDFQKFLEFYNIDTIEERFARQQKDYITKQLRTLTLKDGIRTQLYILIRINNGAQIRYLSCVRDITEITKTQEGAVQNAQDSYWYHLLADELQTSILDWNLITKEAHASGGAYKYALSQSSLEEILANEGSMDAVYAEDLPVAYRFFEESKSGAHRAEAVMRLKMMDGTYRWSRLIGLFEYNDQGQQTHVTGIITDVEQEQNNMRRSQFLNQMPTALGVFEVVDNTPRQLFFNDEYYRLIEDERTKRQVDNEKMGFLGSIHPEERPLVSQAMKTVIDGNSDTCSEVCRVRTGSGDYKWIRFTSQVSVRKENYIQIYSTYVSVDEETRVSQEKEEAKKRLDENRKKERMLMAGIPGGVAIYRMKKDGSVMTEFVSDGLARMCGYNDTDEFQEYLRDNAMINVVEEDIPKVIRAAKAGMDTGNTISVMYRIHVKGSADILQRLDANIMDSELEPDDISVWYAVHTIVSDESKEILKNQENLHNLIDNVPAGIGIYEITGHKIVQSYINTAFYEMLGTTRERRSYYFGENTMNAVHPQDAPAIQEAVDRLFAGANMTEITYRIKMEDEQWFWVHLAVTVVERRTDYLRIYAAFSNYNEIIQAQQELENNRNMLRTALQTAKVFSWRYDYKRNMITDSGTLGEAFHLPKEVHNLPQSILDMGFVDAESEEAFRELYRGAATEKSASVDVKSTVKGEHGVEWFHQVYEPVFDSKGNYIDSVGIAVNITEQKLREHHYEEQLRLNQIATKDALSKVNLNLTRNEITDFYSRDARFDPYKEYTTANGLLESIFQVLTQESEKQEFLQIANTDSMIQKFRQGTSHLAVTCNWPNTIEWIQVTYDMIENPYTGDIEAIGAIHDVTDNKQMEFIMNRLVTIDYESVSLIDMNCRRIIPFKNSNWNQDLNHLIAKESHWRMLLDALETQPYFERTATLQQNGQTRYYRMVYSYLEQNTKVLLCAAQDITDIYLQEMQQKEELETALKEAQAANEAKTAFLSRVSHDMRTPLNGILGLTALMKDHSVDQQVTKDLNQLELSGQYLLNLINDTLDVNRIESGKLELHPTVCDSREVFNNILNLTRVGMEEKSIRLEMMAEHLPFTLLYVDEGRLQQIALNVLGNAIKFTPDDGVIRCVAETLSNENGIVTDHFVIQDTGCGMSEDFLPHIFEPFSQEDGARTNSRQGTGLGMAITKRLVEMMDGEIKVSSKLGQGTTFDIILRLPVATDEQIETWNHSLCVNTVHYHLQGKRILLCEDHPLNTQIATRVLQKEEMLVEHAANGQEGLDMFADSAEGYYDAILMDIRMPVMDGLDTAQAIRNLPRADAKKVPIIAMTANALGDDVRNTRKVGMNAHLSKPIEPERLYGVLEHFTNLT